MLLQIHKILGMEKLPAASPPPSERKRPREEEEGAAKADGGTVIRLTINDTKLF